MHEQLISNGGGFNPTFAERDNNDNDIFTRNLKNWFKNHSNVRPHTRLSRLWAQKYIHGSRLSSKSKIIIAVFCLI
jgi:hypothetical protein